MADVKENEYRSAFKGEVADAIPTPGYHIKPSQYFQILNLYNATGLLRSDYVRLAQSLVLEQFKSKVR